MEIQILVSRPMFSKLPFEPRLQRDEELMEIVKEGLRAGYIFEEEMRRLITAGYVCESSITLIVSAPCYRLLSEDDPEYERELERIADWNEEDRECGTVMDAAELNGLLGTTPDYEYEMGYHLSFTTERGETVDGLQLLHALIDPHMPFITMAVQFDEYPKVDLPAYAMRDVLYEEQPRWIQMRKRILASLTDKERILVGLPTIEKLSERAELDQSTESPLSFSEDEPEDEMEEKVRDLILSTARRLKRARDRAHGRPPGDGWW